MINLLVLFNKLQSKPLRLLLNSLLFVAWLLLCSLLYFIDLSGLMREFLVVVWTITETVHELSIVLTIFLF